MRADIPTGSQIAQILHAAGESTPTRVPSGTVAVALAARDEAHIRDLDAKLTAAGIPHTLIVECSGEAMAIGCEPTTDRDRIRRVLSMLPLVGRRPRSAANVEVAA